MDTDQMILEALSDASAHLTTAAKLAGDAEVTPIIKELLQTATALLKVRRLAWERTIPDSNARQASTVGAGTTNATGARP